MESDGSRDLGTARLIVTLMYAAALVVFPMVGRVVEVEASVDQETLRVVTLVLGMVAAVDYVVSLVLEQRLLARKAAGGQSPVVTAAVLVGAFGVSLAVYGLVLTLLGAPKWGALLYVLCALHGLHLMIRWPRYARAAQGAPY